MTEYAFIDDGGIERLRGTIDPAPGGGSQTVKHVVVPITFADISTVTGFADLYLLPEEETVIASWPVVTQAFNGTADGHGFSGVQAYGPSGASGSGPAGDAFNATGTSASHQSDGLIGPDPGGFPSNFVAPILPGCAPVPGGGSVQVVLDFTGGNAAPYVQGTTGALEYHLVIAVAS